jgi:hypothetical protein
MIPPTGVVMRWTLSFALLGAPLAAQTPDTAQIVRAVAVLERVCAADAGTTWGRSICGPLLLGNWGSKAVIASVADSAGAFTPLGRWWVGQLEARQFPANTAIRVGGTHYSMVVMPLPDDEAIAATLLAHEQFHRIQRALGLPPQDPGADYLDEEAARRWLRLEYRALARAIATRGEASCGHARDALAFRAARHRAFPEAATAEPALERHEGLAESTGQRLAGLAYPGGEERLVEYLGRAESTASYVRSFAYATGAGYGALLDRADPAWRAALSDGSGPAALLAKTLRCASGQLTARARADRYGGTEITALERVRADSLVQLRADFTARLVDGPVLRTPPGALNFTFDPNGVTPLAGEGNVYPGGTFSGPWGSLEVESGGVLVRSDFQQVRVGLAGDGVSRWRLTVTPGWRVVAEGGDLTIEPPGS